MDNAAERNAVDNPENPSSEQQPQMEAMEAGQTTEAQALEGQGEHDHGEPGHTHPSGPPPMDPACKREINVEIPADVVAKHQETLVRQYSKQARIPGFRKGKVPASMVAEPLFQRNNQ